MYLGGASFLLLGIRRGECGKRNFSQPTKALREPRLALRWRKAVSLGRREPSVATTPLVSTPLLQGFAKFVSAPPRLHLVEIVLLVFIVNV